MSDDLISRQALRSEMYHEAFEKDSDEQRWDGGCWIRYKMFERVVDRQPSAQPNVHDVSDDADYISRETMKDAIDSTTWYHQNRNKDMVEGASDEETAWFKTKDVFKAIENVPSAQPERKGGKWIYLNGLDAFECSVCGRQMVRNIFDYCPWCGARMNGGDDGGET